MKKLIMILICLSILLVGCTHKPINPCLKETCGNALCNAECGEDYNNCTNDCLGLCANVICSDSCNSNVLLTNGACQTETGLCQYQTVACKYGCNNNACGEELFPAGTIFVSSINGIDTNDGLSKNTPIKTISRANQLLSGKNSVNLLFERGSFFRMTSDAYISVSAGTGSKWSKYGNYGDINKPLPLFYGSIEANSNWRNLGNNIWEYPGSSSETLIGNELLSNPSFDSSITGWSFWTNVGATGSRTTTEFDTSPAGYRINITTTGASDGAQLYASGLNLVAGKTYKITFRARASSSIKISVKLMQANSPWSDYSYVSIGSTPVVTTAWQTFNAYITSSSTDSNGRVTFYHIAEMPAGSYFLIDTLSIKEVSGQSFLSKDIGNIIFNNGQSIGKKVWNTSELKVQGDFYMLDPNRDYSYSKLWLYSTQDPTLLYNDIELAVKQNLLSMGSNNYIIVDGLDMRYGALHGLDGTNIANIVLRNNNLYMIGGALQYYKVNSSGVIWPVRYGNCIEFGCRSNNIIVENNTIEQCYDTALTSQAWDGCGPVPITNTRYTGNIVKNIHYGFEIFSSNWSSSSAVTKNFSVDHNTFIGQGKELWYNQRPDGGSGYMRLSRSPPNTNEFMVVNNIIADGRDYAIYQGSGSASNWQGNLTLDYNLYSGNRLFIAWSGKTYADLTAFRTALNKEIHGQQVNPNFDNNYKPSGIACTMSNTGSYVGAIPCN